MAKGQKINLPENVNFRDLVDQSIATALADPVGNNITNKQKEALGKITLLEKKIIATALEKAASDGLYADEVSEVLGDVKDLISHGWKTKGFDKMMQNPADAKFALSPATVSAVQSLTAAEKENLRTDLKSQKPDLGERFLSIFEEAYDALLPIFQIIAVGALKIGSGMLSPLIDKNVDKTWAPFLKDSVAETTEVIAKLVINDPEANVAVQVTGADTTTLQVETHVDNH